MLMGFGAVCAENWSFIHISDSALLDSQGKSDPNPLQSNEEHKGKRESWIFLGSL